VNSKAWFFNGGGTAKELARQHERHRRRAHVLRRLHPGRAEHHAADESYNQQNAALGLDPSSSTAPTTTQIRTQLALHHGSGVPTDVYLPNTGPTGTPPNTLTGGIYVQGEPEPVPHEGGCLRQPGLRAQAEQQHGHHPGEHLRGYDHLLQRGQGTTTTYQGTMQGKGIMFANGAINDLRGPDRVSGTPPPALAQTTQLLVTTTGDIVVQRDVTCQNFDTASNVLGLYSSGGQRAHRDERPERHEPGRLRHGHGRLRRVRGGQLRLGQPARDVPPARRRGHDVLRRLSSPSTTTAICRPATHATSTTTGAGGCRPLPALAQDGPRHPDRAHALMEGAVDEELGGLDLFTVVLLVLLGLCAGLLGLEGMKRMQRPAPQPAVPASAPAPAPAPQPKPSAPAEQPAPSSFRATANPGIGGTGHTALLCGAPGHSGDVLTSFPRGDILLHSTRGPASDLPARALDGLSWPERLERLRELLRGLGSVIVAYSGGRGLEPAAARGARDARRARAGRDRPLRLLRGPRTGAGLCAGGLLRAQIEIVTTGELANPVFRSNPADRCYHCKSELYRQLEVVAQRRGAVVVDGTIVDDLADWRPGRRAAGSTACARRLPSPAWQGRRARGGGPSWPGQRGQAGSPCLASRIPYGTEITPQNLAAVEQAEGLLRSLGFGESRVRHHGDTARIEVPVSDLARFGDPDRRRQAVEGLSRWGIATSLWISRASARAASTRP